ncbi:MAG: thioredoxin [Candidatus Schekmanbacteria bacterium RIFCSPHIGHO2_02_FULL_38_11]|uniref:Thioredoxin n=1 Tax=Candidatus Schekmanbacteria bacterium RIFCSPLOWO2_12_FULL_38_15 TaxID=1817883 RepID=A0A1F7SF92_9BACT|nr:MAG: thioredoxin [Candidatus Schekmanbacteria bacterium GWA2_38_9]OGL52450.1 MAG: thioredoxin [Candidatus Schekmanbacteria bacterium RIFCSPLOWO2_12_FULL_38_15]OGL52917.1 MAG: thioredoxin [Candidatus Schekmanbacteria bacterium RIFCSPHIGHO2_02_FULL_38_11]
MGREIEITEKNFEQEVLKSDIPVLVDFWATWCGPCRMVAPVVEEISEEYSGKVKVGKLNIDDNPSIASKYKVMSIPTLMLFKGGAVVDHLIGAQSKVQIKAMIDKA